MESYDGGEAIERAWRDGLKPDPLLTVSEWADRYRVLSQRASSEPGRWRTERTPYLKEIMDCLSPSSPVQRVVFMKGSQTGGTEAGNNFIGYVIHEAPGPMMAVAPTVELAKRNSKQRLDPLIEESEVLRERVKELGLTQHTEIDFDLDNATPAPGVIKKKCHDIRRKVEDELGAQEFTLRQVLLNAAKNGFGPSAAGTFSPAEGPSTAEPAETTT